MKLYLCRHAQAEDTAAGGDAHRALTSEGRREFKRVARGLAELKVQIDRIVTSPYLRAMETAEILAEQFSSGHGKPMEIVSSAALACGGQPELVLTEMRATAHPPREIIAVGHEPDIGGWLGRLCFGQAGRCRFKKGAIACIELDDGLRRGELLFLLQPGQMVRLGS